MGCLPMALIAVLLATVAVAGAWFWYNRPIKPVELSQEEVQVVEKKIETMEAEPAYEAGVKEIVITEREFNGLLNENTSLGDKLKLTLATDEVHARLDTDIAEDVPVLGGKRLKARARFLVKMVESRPSLVLDDLTIWGVSVPNDWLGGIKGKDLLSDIFGGGVTLSGVEEMRIERDRLIIKLKE